MPSKERKYTGMSRDAYPTLLSPLIAGCEIGKPFVQGDSANPDSQDTSHAQDCHLPGASPSRSCSGWLPTPPMFSSPQEGF